MAFCITFESDIYNIKRLHMPQSRHRHKHHRHHPNDPARSSHAGKTARRNPVTIMVVFVAILGIILALLSAGTDPLWLSAGALGGGVVGYFIGKRMSRLS
jgi:hypothetical protein